LEETSITRLNSLEELAEIALRQDERPNASSGADRVSDARDEPRKGTPER